MRSLASKQVYASYCVSVKGLAKPRRNFGEKFSGGRYFGRRLFGEESFGGAFDDELPGKILGKTWGRTSIVLFRNRGQWCAFFLYIFWGADFREKI